MNAQLQTQPKVEPPPAQPALRPARAPILQRKCACGGSASGFGGDCNECKKYSKSVQFYSADRSAWSILLEPNGAQKTPASRRAGLVNTPHSFAAPARVPSSAPASIRKKRFHEDAEWGYGGEPQIDQFSDQAAPVWTIASPFRFAPAAPGEGAPTPEQATRVSSAGTDATAGQSAKPSTQATSVSARTRPSLIVDDNTTQFTPVQMRKTEFLTKVEGVVHAAASSELARVGRSTQECPYIARWMGYYRARSGRHIEAALHRYAPEAAGARSAEEYIPVVADRVRRAAAVWVATGRITGVPDELARKLTGGGAVRAIDAFLSRRATAFDDDSSKAGDGAGDARRQVDLAAGNDGDVTHKTAAIHVTVPGHESSADDETAIHNAGAAGGPEAIVSRLGPGGTLDSGVKARMESAFGHDFSRVRVHTDARAATLSSNLNARAFTAGSDIAFGEGEYRPGSIAGEALIAHELAHVVQQGAVIASTSTLREEGEYDRLEEDADASAFGVMASLLGGVKGALAGVAKNTKPAMRSGLGLQRCKQETCSVGVKNISIDLIKLRGSNRTPATDVTAANNAYKKCCVQFTKGQEPPVPNDLSNKWLGGDTDVRVADTCGAVGAEEKAMYDGAASEFKLSSRMRAFYVESFSGVSDATAFSLPPYCATGGAAPYVNHLIIQNIGRGNTLAHELGHILLNSPAHQGIDNPADRNNVMFGPGSGFDIDDSQCKKIYNNA